jgi:hypothetical protein
MFGRTDTSRKCRLAVGRPFMGRSEARPLGDLLFYLARFSATCRSSIVTRSACRFQSGPASCDPAMLRRNGLTSAMKGPRILNH